jgi:type IV secretory pathway TraG/TraD family ATPase VirD4
MNDKNEMSDRSFLLLLTGFLGVVVFYKFKRALWVFYIQHRIAIAVIITALILRVYFWTKSKILKRFEAADHILEITTAAPDEDAVFAGLTKNGKRVSIKHIYRRMHTQVVGTTNAGKTESIIIVWAVDDIRRDRGLIIIDGKSDKSLLNKLYAYAKRHGREQDVRILSLCDVGISHTFNPLIGGSPLEVTERVFQALNFENEYFKSLQYEAMLHTLIIFEACKVIATPVRVIEFLRSPAQVSHLSVLAGKKQQLDWALDFARLTREEREQRTSGLLSQLQAFAVGETAQIFNAEKPDIDLEQALQSNQIIYCQLPVLKVPALGKMTGKMILQCLQGAISSRHLGRHEKMDYFSVYLDDFTEYLTEGFVSLLNKSRSAKVSVVFAHQALGDLASLGEGVRNSILTNANLKVIMRMNESESAEYFSGVIGTTETNKLTERQKSDLFGASKTGEASVRAVEEYKFHPNLFKQQMGVGDAVVLIPHEKGSLPVQLKLAKLPDLDAPEIPQLHKSEPVGLKQVPEVKPEGEEDAPEQAPPRAAVNPASRAEILSVFQRLEPKKEAS